MEIKEAAKSFWERLKKIGQKKVVLIVLAVVLVSVILFLFLDGGAFDGIRRKLNYGNLEVDETGVATLLEYENDSTNRYALLTNSLLVVSNSHITLLDGSGNETYHETHAMGSPSVNSNGDIACVFDVGGSLLKVFTEEGLQTELSNLQGIISATVNSNGYLAVVDSKSGYKGVATVYNESGEKVFEFSSATRFIKDACVTEDNRYCAIVSMGQESGVFVSNILVYRISNAKKIGEYTIHDGLVLEMSGVQGGILSVTDIGVTKGNAKAEKVCDIRYNPSNLRAYSVSSQMTSVLLGKHQSGSAASLQNYSSSGELYSTKEINEEVVSLSSAGRYLAVLYANRLVIYTKDFSEYSILKETGSARRVIMKEDGTVLLIGSSQAWIYIP